MTFVESSTKDSSYVFVSPSSSPSHLDLAASLSLLSLSSSFLSLLLLLSSSSFSSLSYVLLLLLPLLLVLCPRLLLLLRSHLDLAASLLQTRLTVNIHRPEKLHRATQLSIKSTQIDFSEETKKVKVKNKSFLTPM